MSNSILSYRGGDTPTTLEDPYNNPPPSLMSVSFALQQNPVSITLNGTSILSLAILLLLVIHFLDPYLVEIFIVAVPFFLIIRNDYQNFLNLGPGGTPATIRGYARITWLRLWTLRDPFKAPSPDPAMRPARGILQKGPPVPYRAGPRPLVAGIAPQRQIDQHGGLREYHALRETLEALCAARPDTFGTARSCFEKHGLALFARHPINRTCQGEVCHVHHSDHSMHLNLHPEDIAIVLEKGWGQRHPLAWRTWFMSMPVPRYFVMIYGPRDDHELQIICRIIEAAIWFVTAQQVEMAPAQSPELSKSKPS